MSASKARGTAAESAVVKYLRENGHPHAERRALSGALDKGDVAGVLLWTLEVKDCKRDGLPGWVDELTAERINASTPYGAVIHKRRGTTDVGRWFATMDVATLVDITLALGSGGPASSELVLTRDMALMLRNLMDEILDGAA